MATMMNSPTKSDDTVTSDATLPKWRALGLALKDNAQLLAIVLVVLGGAYGVFREYSTHNYMTWNGQRLLWLELLYRLESCVERIDEDACANHVREVLDNTCREPCGVGFGYMVPSLKDRPLDSIMWELVQTYPPNSSGRESLMRIRTLVTEIRGGKLSALKQAATFTRDEWQDQVFTDHRRPKWYWFPNYSELIKQSGGIVW